MKDGIMLLNGQRLVIHGVNRHEWNPGTGRSIGMEDMERAMETYLKSGDGAAAQALAGQYAPRMTAAQKKRFETLFEKHGAVMGS